MRTMLRNTNAAPAKDMRHFLKYTRRKVCKPEKNVQKTDCLFFSTGAAVLKRGGLARAPAGRLERRQRPGARSVMKCRLLLLFFQGAVAALAAVSLAGRFAVAKREDPTLRNSHVDVNLYDFHFNSFYLCA